MIVRVIPVFEIKTNNFPISNTTITRTITRPELLLFIYIQQYFRVIVGIRGPRAAATAPLPHGGQCTSASSTRAVGGRGLFLKLCTGRLCVAQFCHLPLAKHFPASSPLAPWPSVCLLHPSCGAPYVSQREGGGGIEPAVPGDPSERAVVQEVFFQARGPVKRR